VILIISFIVTFIMKITFLGAARTVTGSCYLVETGKHRFLVDCGLFQGPDLENRNTEPLQFQAKELDFILLTHAHMDHSGMLPRIVKEGFRGNIYMTPPTSALAEILLMDAAKIQEGNARRRHVYSESMPFPIVSAALYTTPDAIQTINQFESMSFDSVKEINGLRFRFIRAGHILGAASIVVEYEGKTYMFSGDIGRIDDAQSIIPGFDQNGLNEVKPDYVVMESLYGGLTHPDKDETVKKFLDVINETQQSDGNVIIPSFAVHRTQELLEILKFARLDKLINSNVQVFLDAPLGIAATKIYTDNSHYFNHTMQFFDKIINFEKKGFGDLQHQAIPQTDRFQFETLRIIKFHKQSLALSKQHKSIIIAGSGMAEGGRILNHLAAQITDKQNTILFVGFQAEGTMGRRIVDGNARIKINKKKLKVNARVEYLRGFSAHADEPTLLNWLTAMKLDKLQKIFLVHAEPDRSEAFANKLSTDNLQSFIPDWKQSIELD